MDPGSVRGGIHQYKTKLNGGGPPSSNGRSRRTAAASVDDYLASARQSVEQALALIDREVETAKTALDEAQAHYDEISAGVKERKADLTKKLAALA